MRALRGIGMLTMTVFSAEIAARRFGLLERDGHADADPRAALLAQLDRPEAARIAGPGTMTTMEVQEHGREKARQAKARREALAERLASGAAPEMQELPGPKLSVPSIGEILGGELDLRLAKARETDTPFLERLALFWTNALTVSAERGNVGDYAGAFEREAIRPHLLGRFEDMLVAAATHPAMLLYLDNAGSYGPNSPLGRRTKRGVNENLARETLELHTLGAEGGYTQGDVEELARTFTGWSKELRPDAGVPIGALMGAFPTFVEGMHEPGPRTILGKTYRQDGPAQLVAVLRDLARHPATAHHVAQRLALHFVGEACPAALTASLAQTFRETGGDLRAVYRVLVSDESAGSVPARRLRPPLEHLLVIARLIGWTPKPGAAQPTLKALGQPYFRAPSPAGWPEKDDDWASPVALKRRLDLVYGIAAQFEDRIDPRALAQAAFGPWLSPALARAVERAPSAREGLTLLLMSPEVVRR